MTAHGEQISAPPLAAAVAAGGVMTRKVHQEWAIVGERLGWLEKALGLSGNRVAIELGLNRQTWSRYQLGQRELPISLAGEMRKRWGCSLDWLYLGEEYRNEEPLRLKLEAARQRRT